MKMDQRTKKTLQEIADSLLSCPVDELRKDFEEHIPGYIQRIFTENAIRVDCGSETVNSDASITLSSSNYDIKRVYQREKPYTYADATENYLTFGGSDFAWMIAA